MKKALFLISILILTYKFSFAQKACPTNFDSGTFPEVDKNLEEWNGRIVAFEAVVKEVKEGYVGKPFYKVELGGENIWVGGHSESMYIKEGRTLRILGYLAKVGDDELNKKYNQQKYFIISLGFIDMETKQGSVFPKAKKHFDEWMRGSIIQTKNN